MGGKLLFSAMKGVGQSESKVPSKKAQFFLWNRRGRKEARGEGERKREDNCIS